MLAARGMGPTREGDVARLECGNDQTRGDDSSGDDVPGVGGMCSQTIKFQPAIDAVAAPAQ
ncbi:hypothetical protein MPS_1749 [Mycobacterium pseudoshottsii JCM 15466]|nr:hypothetical protein MPS_1749 [Mycobacterium pseudoshottsii JCM 15466]